MYPLPQRALMAWKWCASFATRDWGLRHYPVWIRRNPVEEPEMAWVAQILGWPGPIGFGATREAARQAVGQHFDLLRAERLARGEALPRPGTREPVRFAAADRVHADPELLRRFIEEVLEFPPGSPVFLSDQSSLHDFGPDDEVERLRGKIRAVFGVETADLQDSVIADILERIRRGNG